MKVGYRVERWMGAEAPDIETLRGKLEAEGYHTDRWSDRPGAVYGLHHHADDQSHWLISGEMEFEVAGVGMVRLGAGDRDFMPAGTEHSAKVIGNVPVVYLVGAKR